MFTKVVRFVGGLPTHVVLISLCLIWFVPVLGLLVTSIRPVQDINQSGWWTSLSDFPGQAEYAATCASCHGADGMAVATADLTDPELIGNYSRSIKLLALLRKEVDGQTHLQGAPIPEAQAAADITKYLNRISGIEARPRFTASNYVDAIVGYRGTADYATDCAAGTQSISLNCDSSDLLNPRGMGRAFVNSLLIAVPSTILPIILSVLAAYAFSWLHFRGRMWIFTLLVALQIVPLQMTLIPISRLYAQLGLNGTFVGVWLFHTGFGLPYSIFLLRNFLSRLPRELFESAHLDGASHWVTFCRLALPLTMPAIASFAIFQFLWIWNDLLVALVFLGGRNPVLTYQISNMVSSLGAGWHLLTAAAFISMILPMIVFFSMQRFFVRGLLAGSVKG